MENYLFVTTGIVKLSRREKLDELFRSLPTRSFVSVLRKNGINVPLTEDVKGNLRTWLSDAILDGYLYDTNEDNQWVDDWYNRTFTTQKLPITKNNMKAKLNIGLNNCFYNYRDVVGVTHNLLGTEYGYISARYHVGEYNGNPEPTAVIELDVHNKTSLIEVVEHLCSIFTQECIAVKYNGKGKLVYNPNFKGQQYKFDPKYFIR